MNTNIQLWRFSLPVCAFCQHYFLLWLALTPWSQNSIWHWITSLWRLCIIGIRPLAISVPQSQSLYVDIAHICHRFVCGHLATEEQRWQRPRSKLRPRESVRSRGHHPRTGTYHWCINLCALHLYTNTYIHTYTHTEHAVHRLRGP